MDALSVAVALIVLHVALGLVAYLVLYSFKSDCGPETLQDEAHPTTRLT